MGKEVNGLAKENVRDKLRGWDLQNISKRNMQKDW